MPETSILPRLFKGVAARRWLIVSMGVAFLVATGELLIWQFDANRRAETEKELLSQLVDARALMEAEISEGLYITIGLGSFIKSQNGEPDYGEIERWMAALFRQARHLRNIGIAPGNRITAVFPKEGNHEVIGLDYRDLPDQWDDVKAAMRTGEARLVGPLDLVQGGRGLIYRRPVFVEGEYWGMISTVMKFGSVMAVIERFMETRSGAYELVQLTSEGEETIAGQSDAGQTGVSQSLAITLPGELRWRMIMRQQLETSSLWMARGVLWGLSLILGAAGWHWWRSSQLARELQARSVEEQTEFIHTVSHELRTPLTSIRGAVGLLEKHYSEDPNAERLFSLASRNLVRLQSLVDDVLDIVRLDASRMNLRLDAEPLAELVQQAVENNEHLAGQRELALHPEIASDAADASVRVDRQRFLQIMDNLLSNAIKFSDPGQVIRICIQRQGEWAQVLVIDEGTGIPASFRGRIFDRFVRADSSDKRRNQSGTGLGLSLVRELVVAMEGDIRIESEEGEGTTVTLSFLTWPRDSKNAPPREKGPSGSSAG